MTKINATPATPDGLVSDLEMARELIQEAKGAEGLNGGFVTNLLDDAEHWIGKVQDALRTPAISSPVDAEGVDREADLVALLKELVAGIHENGGDMVPSLKSACERVVALRTHSPKAEIERKPIMLEMAAADDAYRMWERRWHALSDWMAGSEPLMRNALRRMYDIERPFVDRDGRWGLRDFLDYAGEACGFSTSLAALSSTDQGEGA